MVSTPGTPALARASALAEPPAPVADLIRRGLADPDPVVRLGALDALEGAPAERSWALASSTLSDAVRGVRIRTAELLAAVPTANQPAADQAAFARAAAEFVAAQKLNADRPEARTALANFHARQGRTVDAEAEYRAALRLDPSYTPAAVNLSDLYRQLERDSDGERVLRESLALSGSDAALHHSLGLVLVRLKQSNGALDALRRASELDPEQSRYAYVYAIALQSAGRREDAVSVLKQNLQRHPNDRETLSALINFNREGQDLRAALQYAERLSRLIPDDRGLASLVDELRRDAANVSR